MKTKLSISLVLALAANACSLDIGDLNNPSTDDLENAPTAALVNAAATGLLIGLRDDVAEDNGYISKLGVLGREGYIYAASDPGYITELLQAEPGLDPGSRISGASFWLTRYRNIGDAFRLLRAVDAVAGVSDADREAIRGFAKTMQALDYLTVIGTRGSNGAVIDVDRPAGEPLGPIVCEDGVYAHIAELLDDAKAHLDAAGESFPFALSSGFAGFDTPASFARFNRAIKARVDVYRGEHAGALEALEGSFIDTSSASPELDLGVYHVFGAGVGDSLNELTAFEIYAHPSVLADAELGDRRLGKVRTLREGDESPSERPFTYSYMSPDETFGSNARFTRYPTNTSPVPIIRNEELILLRAEALLGLGDAASEERALEDLNYIRVYSGGLAPRTGPDDPELEGGSLEGELLHQRRYSLLFEGHRWIDVRRFGRLAELPLASPTRHVVHEKFPIPQGEIDARSGQIACTP